ncbi:zinc finger BED domain-containing protein RICESLEEPER 2-like [Henckelia pumila]|uniref:zinc finger BED domain-containing protein RICESLEEPER 2-like n=1 Tax=Henckelia pumila TaxID=405737 RepID=UPI003C6DDF3D
MVYDLFLVEKAKIQSVIGDLRVSITTDTWTSIQNINYMVVTAHFLDNDWKLHKRILNFTKITNHSGEEIGKMVEDGLKELNVSIKAIRNVVVFIHSSPSRLNKFREFAMLAKFSSTSTVPMDLKTRWNATYKMLEAALKYRRVFERVTKEWLPFMNYFHEKNDKSKERIGPPISDDWEKAKAFVHFLKKFMMPLWS